MGRVIAGIGLRRGCGADAILRAVDRASELAGRLPEALATPAFKAAEPGPAEAARRRGLELIRVDLPALEHAQAACVTHSDAALRATGVASVSEACALAAAGAGARLLVPRVTDGGATCALAEAAGA